MAGRPEPADAPRPPWVDDALFQLQMLWMALVGAAVVAGGALAAWALLVQPGLAWWHGGGFAVARDAAHWRPWLKAAAIAAAVVTALFYGLLATYARLMVRGFGKAEH